MSQPGLLIALLGGSFNPPHVGHLLAADYVRATQPFDEVWFVPSYRHPLGKKLVEFEHRVRMCEAMCADASGWLRVSEIERDAGGEGRTVDTLKLLIERFPTYQFTWVIGSDILKDLPHWKDFAQIEKLARVLILQRPGHPSPQAFGPPLVDVSSTEVRELLERGEVPSHLVPRVVLDYARAHRLYGLSG
jgi:nicotinate-nucleotide adenylyltransferase